MQVSCAPGAALGLLDVLEQLPPDVLDAHLCRNAAACHALRSACRAGRALYDGTVSLLCLLDSAEHLRPGLYDDGPPLSAQQLDEWHQEVRLRARTLQRLPRLKALELFCWPSEAGLVTLLLRYGAACGDRLQALTLHGGELGPGLTCSIAAACPALRELAITSNKLSGDILLPLARLSSLTKLKLDSPTPKGFLSDALLSLGVLRNLRSLDIGAHTLAGQPAPSSLAALSALESLVLHEPCVVDDSVLNTLRRLTRLSSLTVPRVALAHPTLAHPPFPSSLRHFARDSYSAMSASDLLSTVVAFQPWAGLQSCRLSSLPFLEISGSCASAADVPVQVANLLLASHHLAAVPAVRIDAVRMTCDGPDSRGVQMTSADVAVGLRPLAAQLLHLALTNFHVGPPSAGLCDSLPAVTRLTLWRCSVTDAALVMLGARWGALRRLSLQSCTGVTGDGWRGLAAVRGAVLAVKVKGSSDLAADHAASPGAALRGECERLQQAGFGRQNIQFV